MTPTMNRTVVGIFDDRTTANKAVEELVSSGFARTQIEINANDSFTSDAASGNAALTRRTQESHGGGIGGWFRRMIGDDDHHDGAYYDEAVRRGGTAVCVHSSENDVDRAVDILDRHGAVDVDSRVQSWKQQGYKGFDTDVDSERDVERHIPVVQEELQVGKRTVDRGGVRVFNRVTEVPVEEQVNLREEHIHVDRRAVNRPANENDIRLADDVVEVTEMAEEPVISKNTRVVEEVVVGKQSKQRTETVRDTVRRSDVEVERFGSESGNFADYDTDFHNDFRTRYGATPNAQYETYAPAYQYGSRMASDKRYNGRRWEDIEADLKRDYQRNYPESKWEQMKDSVRYGWNKVTGRV